MGWFGYGARHLFEDLPERHKRVGQLPDIYWRSYRLVLTFDVATGAAALLTLRGGGAAQERKTLALRDAVLERLAGPLPAVPDVPAPFGVSDVRATAPEAHEVAIRQALHLIREGETYQVNLARLWRLPKPRRIREFYCRLRRENPAAFGAWFPCGRDAVLSVSPERFLKVIGRQVETQPIKGTAARSESREEDKRAAEGLLASAKDRAELAMIVDILRNDLSRVCRPGTVCVERHAELESHPTVHHLVSTITGEMEPGHSLVDLVAAALPGGSITGAPRIRAMEIINDLEPAARGPYCGSLGYIGYDGRVDLNILIRTLWTGGSHLFFQGGGGIVADSDPQSEVEETEAKVRGILRALVKESSTG